MQLVLNILGVGAGLGLGFWAGHAIGTHYESRRRALWTAGVSAFIGAWAIDFAGFMLARPEISIGSIGLMAGLLTGLKYGGFPAVRVWEAPPAQPDEPAHTEALGEAEAPDAPDAPRTPKEPAE